VAENQLVKLFLFLLFLWACWMHKINRTVLGIVMFFFIKKIYLKSFFFIKKYIKILENKKTKKIYFLNTATPLSF
jgi:hypothetical protein